ncbi:hypothetical protein Vretimale_12973 [Volvox reticuliferus]|nr:hypothetical protein Vretimale_12973 [Volvox reticuliferus]
MFKQVLNPNLGSHILLLGPPHIHYSPFVRSLCCIPSPFHFTSITSYHFVQSHPCSLPQCIITAPSHLHQQQLPLFHMFLQHPAPNNTPTCSHTFIAALAKAWTENYLP